jgi:hypothetical protein
MEGWQNADKVGILTGWSSERHCRGELCSPANRAVVDGATVSVARIADCEAPLSLFPSIGGGKCAKRICWGGVPLCRFQFPKSEAHYPLNTIFLEVARGDGRGGILCRRHKMTGWFSEWEPPLRRYCCGRPWVRSPPRISSFVDEFLRKLSRLHRIFGIKIRAYFI